MHLPISAIICTYNRADLVVQAIENLARQTLGRDQYEIVVVDNGSSDYTRQRVEDKCHAIPNLRYASQLHAIRGWSLQRGAYLLTWMMMLSRVRVIWKK